MKRNLNSLVQALKNGKTDKKAALIVLFAVFGIILIVISSLSDTTESIEENTTALSTVFSEYDYTSQLEKKLEGMVSSLSGAGRTKVTVTLECDYETVYARDGSYSVKDGASDEESEYIIIDSDRQEGGLVLKTVTPKVRGVAVLCEGGNVPEIESAVCEMLEALLNIGSNRISVAKIQ